MTGPKRGARTPAPQTEPAVADPAVRWLSGAILLLLVLFLSLTRIRDSDTWWHLKTGELILARGIPRTDPFSYVLAGHPWIAMEWLSEAIFYLLFKGGGAAALTGVKAAVLAAAFLLLWSLEPDRPLWSCIVLSFAALTARQSFVERPFIFDYLLVAAMSFLFWHVRFRDPPRRLLWAVPLICAAWANLHGGAAVLAPALTALAAAAERLRDPEVPLRRWALVAGLGALALLLNPHGTGILVHLWRTLTFPGKEAIREWHAPTHQYLGLYGLSLAAGIAGCFGAFKRKPFAAAWALAAAAASMRMERNIPIYALLSAPVVAIAYAPRALRRARPGVALAAGLGIAGAAWAQTSLAQPYLRGRFGIGTDEPLAGAATFLDEAGIPGRMFNEYESGGYLIWRGYPRRQVFIDGRSLEYGPGLVRDALGWYRPREWQALDGKWRFDYAVIARHPTGAYTARVLEESPDWQNVYWDDTSLVYLRRVPEHEGLLRRYGYRLLQPGRAVFQYIEPPLQREDTARALLAELDRSVAEARGGCVNALLMKAYVLSRLKRWTEAQAAGAEAAERFPRRAQPRFTLGWVLESAGDPRGAERQYLLALERVTPDERSGLGADILNNLGRMREKDGDLEQAREYYSKSLRWNPGQVDARRNLGRLPGGAY